MRGTRRMEFGERGCGRGGRLFDAAAGPRPVGARPVCGSCLAADERAGIEFFESKIRPVLVERCQKCHSAELAKPKGQLRLDTREAMRTGRDVGPGGRAGGRGGQRLYPAITAADGYSPMPPKEKLPPRSIADFRRWIEMGAPDPRDGSAASARRRHRVRPAPATGGRCGR